jgi:hypothetical protein
VLHRIVAAVATLVVSQPRRATMNDKHTKLFPWNKGRLIGPKPPLRQSQVWSIRTKLQLDGRARDLALFNLAIDSKLRGCDLVALRVNDIAPHGSTSDRANIRQKKTGRPVRFEITEQTRQSVDAYLALRGGEGLDKELERRGHRFCRYADDCNIYVRSQAAGERVMPSVVSFLESKLRLKVNAQKSAVAPVMERSFLGHRLLFDGRIGIAPKSLDRAKAKLRHLTRRNRGIALERRIADVNGFTTGWVTYFRHASCKGTLGELDEWLRRKLRCVRLKQCKRAKPMSDFLRKQGVPAWRTWSLAASGKGWWRSSASHTAHEAMPNAWFEALGLVALSAHHAKLQPAGNRRVR